jgi:hypothetical protein
LSSGRGRSALDRAQERFGKLPLYFVENIGQTDSTVRYYIPGNDRSIYFANNGVTLSFSGQSGARIDQRWAVKLDFVGANPDAHPEGLDETEARVSYFSGSRSNWKTGARTYSRVIYRDLWPGIDLIYSGAPNRLKYSLHLRPGADPNRIRLAYRGADVRINGAGELEVTTPVTGFHDESPRSFQNVDGTEREVQTKFQLTRGTSSVQTYGFTLGKYDPRS